MTRGQRLAVSLVAAATLLLVGRGFALLYVGHAWYTALGATSVWWSKVEIGTLIYVLAIGIGTAFVFINLTAVRRSVVALVLPARIGNVEVGKEIPSSRLALLAGGMSVCAAGVSALAVPLWTTVALWQSDVWFNEADPYFGLDLGYYVAWLPLEWALYVWSFIVFTIAVMLVVSLYALTPNLKWERGAFHVTTHARRHITILATLLVLFIAWGFHLDAYTTLIHGNGPAGMFTRFDHQWLIPTDLFLAIVMVGTAVVLFAAGWRGQTRMAFGTITAVILCYTAAKLLLPWISSIQASSYSTTKSELSYATTQRLYTAHAFPQQPHSPPSTKFAADTTLLAIASKARQNAELNPEDVVYPGAHGVMIVPGFDSPIPAPRVGGLFSRIMHAWGEQDASVLDPDVWSISTVTWRRDLRQRIAALAPIFAQSHTIGARLTSFGILWILDLYTTSDDYPLSAERQHNGGHLKYLRHAATAYVNGNTGGVTIVRDSTADPIAQAWFATHPGAYVVSTTPPNIANPAPPRVFHYVDVTKTLDSVYRAHVKDIYKRMRIALDSGNLKGFGEAFDSLGAAVGERSPW